MSPLPFPTAPPVCAIVSYHSEDAAAYAREKHLDAGRWFWVETVATLDEHPEDLHVEYVGMHWRKRQDVVALHEEIERRRARGEIR